MDKKLIGIGIGIAVFTIIAAIAFTQLDKSQEEGEVKQITPIPTIAQEVEQIVKEIDIQPSPATQSAIESATITPMQEVTELIIEDLTVGTGDEAISGKKITVNYKGTLTNGTQFDSSYGSKPFSFTLGAGQVIEGWDKGFAGMKVGGKRKLTIPPELGYGSRSTGSIPPNSILIFEVELLKVE
jgi:peptidylprolyl isomerase/FKBP-type peptidyl-prolyl cis-trans isomerase FkpA